MSELYHHQIKGAHWGERNGPPYPLSPEDHTAAQIKSNPKIAREVEEEKQKAKRNRIMARIVKRSKKDSQKGNIVKAGERAKKMSDDELSEAIKRLRLENEYLDAIQKNNPERQKRDSIVRKAVGDALKQVGTEALKYAFAKGINKFVSSVTGEDAYIVNPDTGKLYGSKKPGQNKGDKDDKGDKGDKGDKSDKDKGSSKSEKSDDKPEQVSSPSPDRPSEEKPKPAPKEEKPPKRDKGKKYRVWAQRRANKEWAADRRASEEWEAMQVSKDKRIGKSRGSHKDNNRNNNDDDVNNFLPDGWQLRPSGQPAPFFPVDTERHRRADRYKRK